MDAAESSTRPLGLRLRRTDPGPAIAALVWSVVYLVFCADGFRFSTAILSYEWQLVPFETLRADPIRSVWFLHIQPPLMNLAVGVVARWTPFPEAITFQVVMVGFGVALATFTASLLSRLGMSSRWSVATAMAATANPTAMRMAFSPRYELPTAVALVVALWFIAGSPPASAVRRLFGVTVIGTALVLTRSIYHPVWLTVLIAPLAWRWRRSIPTRQMAAIIAIPVLCVGGWMAKNQALFGHATLASWTGMNFERAILPVLSQRQIEDAVQDGRASPLILHGTFQSYDSYDQALPPCTSRHDDPAVPDPLRPTPVESIYGGAPVFVANFNHECFLPIYDQAGADALRLSLLYPGQWLWGRAWATQAWFGADAELGTSSSGLFHAFEQVWEVIKVDVPVPAVSTRGWSNPGPYKPESRPRMSVLLLVCAGAVMHRGCIVLVRTLRRQPLPRHARVDAAAAMTLAWTFTASVIGELGEQARLRSVTDPMVIALGIFAISRLSLPLTQHTSTRITSSSTGNESPISTTWPSKPPDSKCRTSKTDDST